jgi:nucleoside-diphosphate-sugar epimerase/pimeloyl-ACP methyl ester carboxylesterase
MKHIAPDSAITGANGLIGRWLMVDLTRRGRMVVALVRNAAARRTELKEFVGAHGGDPTLVRVDELDLMRDDLGVEGDVSSVRDVYHCAGRYAWNLSEHEAHAVNVEGTMRVVRWAAQLPELRRLVYVGGYRMTRLPEWVPTSFPLPTPARKRLYRTLGAYEASKIEAQLAMRDVADENHVPWTIVSPATVSGDSRTGESDQFTGVAESIAMLWRGKMPIGVGTEKTFVPLVPVDHLARVMATLVENPKTLGQELVVLDPHTPPLPELIDGIARHLSVAPPKLNVPASVVRLLPEALTGVPRETLSFLSEDRYDVSATSAHETHAGLARPDGKAATQRWVDYMVSTRFGDAPQAEPGRFISVLGSQSYVVGNVLEADTLFLHGLPWDSESGVPLIRGLSESVARVDLPGLGRSSAADGTTLDWLATLLRSRTKPLKLIGHSFGAGVIVSFSTAHPTLVSELVLVAPYFLQARPARWLRWPQISAQVFRYGGAERLQASLLGEASSPHAAVESTVAQLQRPGVAARTARTLAACADPDHRASLVASMDALTLPTLIVVGSEDPLLQQRPETMVVVTGAGHQPHVSDPEVVARSIRDWRLARSGKTGRTAPGSTVARSRPVARLRERAAG